MPTTTPRWPTNAAAPWRWLVHLSVGGKLSLGFGLVLACTLGVAFAALHALQLSQSSSAQLRVLDRLQGALAEARLAERAFGLAPSAEAAAQVDAALRQLQAEAPRSGSGDDFRTALGAGAQGYLDAFHRYADARRTAVDARLRMQGLAEDTGQSFSGLFLDQVDDINLALEQGGVPDPQQMQLLEEAASLRERLAYLRDSELYFSLEAQKRFRDDWENRVNELGSALSSLASRLDGERRGALDEANRALDQYRQAFLRFVASGEAAASAQAGMSDAATQVTGLLQRERERRAEADGAMRKRLDLQLAAMVLLALATSIAACLAIRRAIVAPLRQMLGLARRIAAGDLAEGSLPIARRDELGQLGEAIGQMQEALRVLVGRIGAEVARLDQAAGSLAGMVGRTGHGVSAQRQQADRVADAMQRVTRSAAQVNVQVEGSQAALGDAGKLIREGDALMREASASLQRLSREVSGSAASMQLLETQSEAITAVLDVISSVAEQTNLLALNAAIEAARAGEHGRGFAVVADEVRALAGRTRSSTGEIETMIQRLGQVTRETAEGLRGSQRLTAEGVDLAGRASGVLASITDAMGQLERTGLTIAQAAAQQHELACQVDEAVARVGEVVEQNARDCAELEAASDSLQLLSASLGGAVGAFRRG
ncbi:hypothetical protein PCA10_25780 [Metapseudomonas resinovorans NBRC 106553]|uniref:Methyl-accepting chemotaxis transducer n=1 Tax=Metapseudomonas resinovorans NBRC 106553 TaxID=1245471 RepID=S6AIQ8_METRE|nr:methyl-accepting chemotaxis protein [Pseudomonas resinovorans]BAN48310.1 hypothetical protein PCA10_25780 [Pseudomonas resinovorans NBRC 106553]